MAFPATISVPDGAEQKQAAQLKYALIKPKDEKGNPRDQTQDAAANMAYASTLDLIKFKQKAPHEGKCLIVGGGPSLKDHLEEIRALSLDPRNKIFALNWAHTWLIRNGIIPHGCMMFEIDADPCEVLKSTHQDVIYYVCSHCHPTTFDGLKDHIVVLWHSPPLSEGEAETYWKHFADEIIIPGGISTFARTIPMALLLGFRDFELFGCDSSYPENGQSTHIDGYPVITTPREDGIDVWVDDEKTGERRHFKTVGYLAYQVEEFTSFCKTFHQFFKLRVHGDSLLRYYHERLWPGQYV